MTITIFFQFFDIGLNPAILSQVGPAVIFVPVSYNAQYVFCDMLFFAYTKLKVFPIIFYGYNGVNDINLIALSPGYTSEFISFLFRWLCI